ncbi:hypothetical protein ASG87_18700 [Frateuria sp. Soil773]|uniref:hypothetical protein n=1 Tax=Frateuria sp. Soil773 TaxID=1736407 RepID=UPI0006F754A7|nr:hypothetical protein [Frateuria sp. Soil773]KRE90584.1 hypothetical protein ASG87_18700 [Frateuria sp. Soil773]
MKAHVRPLLLALLGCALAACDMPDTTMANGAITMRGDTVTLRVTGSPKAVIDADGTFTVDGNTVPTTPAERELLASYNRSVHSVHEAGLAMGMTGGEIAAKAVAAKLSSTQDKAAEDGAGEIKKLTRDICKAQAAIKSTQDQLAAQLAAFAPYAKIIDASDVSDCESDAKD